MGLLRWDYGEVVLVECGRGGILFGQEVRFSDAGNRTLGC